MEFSILHAAFDSWGLCPLDGFLEQHLALDASDFGSAIQVVSVTISFGGPFDRAVNSSLRDLHGSFTAALSKLPRRRFERARQRLTIDFESRALNRAFLIAAWPEATLDALVTSGARLPSKLGPLSVLEANAALLDEIIEELLACAPKLGARVDFRLPEALEWLEGRRRALPATSEEYFALKLRAEAAAAVADAALDEWDRLGIDLRDFHPDAQRVLDAPFFWSCGDEFAPHGNDAGADLLASLQRWRKRSPRASSETFFRRQRKALCIAGDPSTMTDLELEEYVDACLALAFGHIKLDGACPEWAKQLALDAIVLDRRGIEALEAPWEHREERLARLAEMERALVDAPPLMDD